MEDRKYQQPHWYEQLRNQEKFEANMKNIQVGDWVLANQPPKKRLEKGYKGKVFPWYRKLDNYSFKQKELEGGVISKANNKNSNFSSDFFMLPKNTGGYIKD